ncbi:MAG: hypothetical protein IJU65_04970 [Desulfovibrio sp.]|nr:hypothetical protein [Desulfovibrio sp.]
MKPLNYAILKFMTTVEDACAEDIIAALRNIYGNFKAFTPKAITETLLTAEVNGLLEQSRCELDANGELRLFFRAHTEGAAAINRYIRE